jgi:hypothetical protein
MKMPHNNLADATLNVFSERRLLVVTLFINGQETSITFHHPVPNGQVESPYICNFEVCGAFTFSQFVFGEDARQAFNLALHVVESSLGQRVPIEDRET